MTDYKKDIQDIIDKLNEDSMAILAKRIAIQFTVSYRGTGARAPLSALQKSAIQSVAKVNMGAMADFNSALGKTMEKTIEDRLKQGGGYESIRKDIIPLIQEKFGTEGIEIDNRGKIRTILNVDKDGSIYKTEKVIENTYSTTVENYANTVSRTTAHAAYTEGRRAGYIAQGIKQFRYLSANDERVRPYHLSLSGMVFDVGSEQEELCNEALSEINCRCRIIPFMDNPKYDTPMVEFAARKEAAGLFFNEDKQAWDFKTEVVE